jgi:hypothetical protein
MRLLHSTLLVFFFFLPVIVETAWWDFFRIRREQSIQVNGTFVCNGKPSNGTQVQLFDYDMLTLPFLLGETMTGYFEKFEARVMLVF